MKKLFTLLLVLIACSVSAIDMGPYDPGAARKTDLGTMAAEAATDYVATDTFTGHTDATGASVHGLGTISTFASTDYVATSSLAERLDTTNASITGDIDVTGDVGAATVNGVAPLTAAEKTQALVGSSTVDFVARNTTVTPEYGLFKVTSVSLADDAEVNINTLLGGTLANFGRITVIPSGGISVFGEFFLRGASNEVHMGDNIGGSIIDQDGKLCVYSEGAGVYKLKNTLGNTYTFIVVYQGRP